MTNLAPLPRSPELLSRNDSALLIVDVQEKLLPTIMDKEKLVWNIRRLMDGADALGVPIAATEQYPKGLGHSVEPIASRIEDRPEKITFSCGGCPAIFDSFRSRGIHKLLVVGIETHVCVLQTVLDVMAAGFRPYLAIDAMGSRHAVDHQTALGRMESSGATLTTTETALFEWCQAAGTDEFKQISKLVRETPPPVDMSM